MNNSDDIRWKQRFTNYKKALSQLKEFIDLGDLSKFEKQGLIKSFEYTYELGWNTMKDYLIYQGNPDIGGSRDSIREGFKINLISDGDGWMDFVWSTDLVFVKLGNGDGVAIMLQDSSMIADYQLVNDLCAVAKKKKIACQRCILPRGGQDGAAIQRSGHGARTVAVVCGTRYIHTVTESIDKRDLQATIDLLAAWLPTVK